MTATDPSTLGSPIAVTLVEETSFQRLKMAATASTLCTLPDGNTFSPVQYFKTLGIYEVSGYEQNSWPLPIIIINSLLTPIKLAKQWLVHSSQIGYPIESDLVAAATYWTTDLANNPVLEKTTARSGDTNPGSANQIPAARPHPTKPGSMLYGVGAYWMNGPDTFRDSDGAMSFTCGDDDHQLGIAWSAGDEGSPGRDWAVTADFGSYTDFAAFYATVSNSPRLFASDNGKIMIHGMMGSYGHVPKQFAPPNPELNPNAEYPVLTVWVGAK